jgi:hypothetical protein
MLRRMGKVAYEIELPPEARIHPVFHVSQLKPKLGSAVVPLPKLPHVHARGVLQPEPCGDVGSPISAEEQSGFHRNTRSLGRANRRRRHLGRIPPSQGLLPTPCGQGVLIGGVVVTVLREEEG